MNLDSIKKQLEKWINAGFVEGELSVEPDWYILWKPEEVEQFNRDYQLSGFAPGFLSFGGNGGGELLVVNEQGKVFYMPAIGMAPENAVKVANSFQQFEGYMQI